MFSLLVFALLCTGCLAKPSLVNYSFSQAVGGGSGSSFSTNGQGRITGVRVWERSSSYITGIQLRYDYVWFPTVGHQYGTPQEIELYDDEVIFQVSGKYYTNYIYQLIFKTSKGRSLIAGQPYRASFNFYPMHQDAELLMLSGRFNYAGITSLAAHWGSVYMNQGNNSLSGN